MKKPNQLTRKEQRKQKRKEIKIRRNEFFTRKKRVNEDTDKNAQHSSRRTVDTIQNKSNPSKKLLVQAETKSKPENNKVLTTEQLRKKEQKEQARIQKDMVKQRAKQMLQANVEEDRLIRQLEKDLGMNKRKSKSLPKYFSDYGLDYLLEVCDPDARKNAVAAEQGLHEVNDQFEEDFTLMTEQNPNNDSVDSINSENADSEIEYDQETQSDSPDDDNEDEEDTTEYECRDNIKTSSKRKLPCQEMVNCKRKEQGVEHDDDDDNSDDENNSKNEESDLGYDEDNQSDSADDDNEYSEDEDGTTEYDKRFGNKNSSKRKLHAQKMLKSKRMKQEVDHDNSYNDNSISDLGEYSEEEAGSGNPEANTDDSDKESDDDTRENKGFVKRNPDGTWEDIYGRLRSKDGSVIQKKPEDARYVPPALRQKTDDSQERKHREKMNRLRKQLKGLINRLAESNMHSIASEIEDLYMNNSRNDMNNALTSLILESVVSEVIVPERLLIEHVVLVTILHANVGTEVGAHFLQQVVKDFDRYLKERNDVGNKSLDNIVNILAQLYNFRLFDSKLIYEVLEKLSLIFDEKCVECILHILRGVGFSLRKDDPLALKALILQLQKQAANTKEETGDNARVNFMLDILLAIKNNNVKKIPNYDTSYSEHLKKVMKGFIRKTNYVTQLNISLEDLLKAEQKGKWWVVGSAWTGNESEQTGGKNDKGQETSGFSRTLLQLAKQQKMNTDTRRNIFCILMTAEDYMDAFEKILKLGLKNQQEREIINVILHCCLQEKKYNPYYGCMAQKLCDYNRRFQMTIKCSVWDKLKTLEEHSGNQLSNLAKLLTHLFVENGLAISTLKIVHFSELDNVTLRFIRQILIGILLHKDEEACLNVFTRVAKAEKLKIFRESLRLFIHHFLLRNLKAENILESHREALQNRAKLVEKILST